jgi:hypothetical protein
MKKRGIALVCGGALLLAISICGFVLHGRSVQREWPGKQLESAVRLGKALSIYHDAHGSYPDRLSDLIDAGVIPVDQFVGLQFRATPSARPEEWLYHRPESLGDIAIVAPVLTYPLSGHAGYRATARADGGGELIPGAKDYRILHRAEK